MRAYLAGLLLLTVVAPAAMAQVGHPPDQSPYHEIPAGHVLTPLIGFVRGDGGPLGVGPHNGTIFGGRYDVRANRTVGMGVSVASGNLERLIVNPFVKVANRTTGPVSQRVTFADVTLQLNLTGAKSWNGLAPYAGLSAGLAFGKTTPADTSGYKFGNKFYVAPQVGTRFFLTSRLLLRAEVRGTFWKLNYPSSFATEPVEEPGTSENPNAVRPSGDLGDWVLTPVLRVGVGYLIHW